MAETATDKKETNLLDFKLFGYQMTYSAKDAAEDAAWTAGMAAAGTFIPVLGNAAGATAGVARGVGMFAIRNIFKAAAKEGAEVAGKAAAKNTVEWVAPKLSKEAAEFAAGKAAERATREAAEAAAKATTTAGVSAATKGLAAEAVEKTSSSVLGTALKAGSYAWTGIKVASFPVRHPMLTLGGLGLGTAVFGDKFSAPIWDAGIGTWNTLKEYTPGVVGAGIDGSLKIGDGLMSFLGMGAKKGASGLAENLPFGTPAVIKGALGTVGATPATGGEARPSLKERAADAAAAAKDKAEDLADDFDFMDAPEIGPFREMIAKHFNLDAKKITGKQIMTKVTEMAKENPYAASGLAFGMLYGASQDGTKRQKAVNGMMYGVVFALMFQMIGHLYPGFFPGMKTVFENGAKHIFGADTAGLGDKFRDAKNGFGKAPTSAPADADNKPSADSRMGQFDRAAQGQPVPELKPAAAKAPTTGENSIMAMFRDDGAQMTDLGNTAPATQRDPVIHQRGPKMEAHV